MKVSGVDPNSGKEIEIEIQNPEIGFFESMRNVEMSDEAIKRMIDNLGVSADAKSLLYTVSKVTIKVGEFIVNIGRKILDVVCYTFREFPKTTFMSVFGGIVGMLISSIPFLGIILGPLVTPILVALGMVAGLTLDFQDKLLENKILRRVAEFAPLAGK